MTSGDDDDDDDGKIALPLFIYTPRRYCFREDENDLIKITLQMKCVSRILCNIRRRFSVKENGVGPQARQSKRKAATPPYVFVIKNNSTGRVPAHTRGDPQIRISFIVHGAEWIFSIFLRTDDFPTVFKDIHKIRGAPIK